MKLNFTFIFILFSIVCCLQAKITIDEHLHLKGEPYPEQNAYWFEQQILDHFVQQPVVHWKQRYYVQKEYFEEKTGPLFLYISGESVNNGFSTTSFVMNLAQKFDGVAISLEHRFYGQSQPFGQNENSWSVENLRYLTHQQGLEDLANFILFLKKENMYGIHEQTPVIIVGGSYAGAMSAWFRYKYDHLTIGSLASSAVVNAIDDFTQYDTQIGDSVQTYGDYCPTDIETITAYAQSQVVNPETSEEFKSKFNAQMLKINGDFLYYFADLFADQVQYSESSNLCNNELKDQPFDQQLDNIIKYATTTQKLKPANYDQETLKNTAYQENSSSRQWTYQTCTYFGWFQTAPNKRPMRSPLVDLQYFQDLCENVYGKDYIPNTQNTNLIMGGTDMNVSNIIFTNGSQDPWRWASIQKDQFPMKALIGDCDTCGHCFDLTSPYEGQPQQKTDVQEEIVNTMELWIGQYWDEQSKIQTQQKQ